MNKAIVGTALALGLAFSGIASQSLAANEAPVSLVQAGSVGTTVPAALLEACRKGLTGFDKNDRAEMIAALDENVVFEFSDSLPYGGTYTNKKEFLAFWKHVYKEYEYFNYDARAVLASGDYIIIPVVARAKTKSGYSMENEHLFLFRVKDGKIVYGRIYADTARGRDVLEGHQPRKYPKLILE
jgi:ketosteroid isomerase-like protein